MDTRSLVYLPLAVVAPVKPSAVVWSGNNQPSFTDQNLFGTHMFQGIMPTKSEIFYFSCVDNLNVNPCNIQKLSPLQDQQCCRWA